MILGSHKLFIFLTLIGILAVEPYTVSGIRSVGIELRFMKQDHGIVMNHRMLKAVINMDDLKRNPSSEEAVNKKFSRCQSSKRTVRKGSDPIHNRA